MGKKYFRRKQNTIKTRDRILIACEGEETEPNYFAGFRSYCNVTISIEGTGKNTVTLVRKAINYMNKEKAKRQPFDYVWCVFDIDDNTEENIKNAIDLANSNNIKYVYSNQSFELWYLLHYSYHNVAIPRSGYITKLSQLLPFTYTKNNKDMFETVFKHQNTAINNAKRLIESYPHRNFFMNDPSTTVYELVEILNSYRI